MKKAALTITVENRVEELTRIYAAMEGFADETDLPEPTRRVLMLVVEELFTNVVNYGYKADVADLIALTMERQGEEVTLTIRDRGKPFDASRAPKRPLEELTLDDMPVGGLGLFLVHQFAKSVTSRRYGDSNVTEVRVAVDDAQATRPT
jgi:serine/threonine-protein kinase RsbW